MFTISIRRFHFPLILSIFIICGLFDDRHLDSVMLYLIVVLICVSLFPDSSASKESACNAGDPGLIPGLRRSAAEGIGYPLQYSWASLMAQLVKNLPAMWDTWVQSLRWEDPLEKEKATHSSILARKIP